MFSFIEYDNTRVSALLTFINDCKLMLVTESCVCLCMTRSKWLELRREYLSLQKANIAQLKSSLKTLKKTNTSQPAGYI